jgi:hypothetical protein
VVGLFFASPQFNVLSFRVIRVHLKGSKTA